MRGLRIGTRLREFGGGLLRIAARHHAGVGEPLRAVGGALRGTQCGVGAFRGVLEWRAVEFNEKITRAHDGALCHRHTGDALDIEVRPTRQVALPGAETERRGRNDDEVGRALFADVLPGGIDEVLHDQQVTDDDVAPKVGVLRDADVQARVQSGQWPEFRGVKFTELNL